VLLDTKGSVETEVIRATVAITPTLYSSEGGGVVLHNYITINLDSAAFREFNTQMNDLLLLLRQSNEISGETREQLIAEMKAGMEILTSRKPDPKLNDLFLKRSLLYMTEPPVLPLVQLLPWRSRRWAG
jgi:hypothetical protein